MAPASPARFPLFDSLRAIAALSVVLYHMSGYVEFGAALDFVAQADVGVVIFFCVSGFLLYRPFVAAHLESRSLPDAATYAWRRVLRIVPAYWVALTLIALWLGRDEVLGNHGVRNYSFTQIYAADSALSGIGPAWSLCVELSFYLFLPVWAWLLRRVPGPTRAARLRNEGVGLVVLVLFSLWFKQAVLVDSTPPGGFVSNGLTLSLPRWLDMFAVGMALAVTSAALEGREPPAAARVLARAPIIGLVIAGGAFWAVSKQIGLSGPPDFQDITTTQAYERHYLHALVGLGLLLPVVFGDPRQGIIRRALGNRVLTWLGLISYAVYLWHQDIVFQLAKADLPAEVADATGLPVLLVYFVLVLALVLPIAWLSWVLVERPILRLKPYSRVRDLGALGPGAATVGIAAFVLLLVVLPAPRFGVLETALTAGALLALAGLVPNVRARLSRLRVVPGTALLGLGACLTLAAAVRLVGAEPNRAEAVVAADVRTHVAGTFDGRVLTLFVDGVGVASRRMPGRVEPGVGPLEIGAIVGQSNWFGTIDDVAVYTRALSADAVKAHYEGGERAGVAYADLVRRSPGLFGYWRLGEVRGPFANAVPGPSATPDGTLDRGVAGLIRRDPDRAISLDGASGRVLVPERSLPDLTRAFTLEAWVTVSSLNNRHLVGRADGAFVKVDDTGRWAFGVYDRGRIQQLASETTALPKPPPTTTSGNALLALLASLTIGGGAWLGRTRPRRRTSTGTVSTVTR